MIAYVEVSKARYTCYATNAENGYCDDILHIIPETLILSMSRKKNKLALSIVIMMFLTSPCALWAFTNC